MSVPRAIRGRGGLCVGLEGQLSFNFLFHFNFNCSIVSILLEAEEAIVLDWRVISNCLILICHMFCHRQLHKSYVSYLCVGLEGHLQLCIK